MLWLSELVLQVTHFPNIFLNEGFGVVGVDGLKIEHVHTEITGGRDENGNYIQPKPVYKL